MLRSPFFWVNIMQILTLRLLVDAFKENQEFEKSYRLNNNGRPPSDWDEYPWPTVRFDDGVLHSVFRATYKGQEYRHYRNTSKALFERIKCPNAFREDIYKEFREAFINQVREGFDAQAKEFLKEARS